jgi:MFS family permease
MIAGGNALGGVFGGLVVNTRSDWRWIFWMCSILHGSCFAMIALFYQETNFARPEETETANNVEAQTETVQANYSFCRALSVLSWYDR